MIVRLRAQTPSEELSSMMTTTEFTVINFQALIKNNNILIAISHPFPVDFFDLSPIIFINPLASPSAGAPALKYGYVNTVTNSPSEVKWLNDKYTQIIKNQNNEDLHKEKIFRI